MKRRGFLQALLAAPAIPYVPMKRCVPLSTLAGLLVYELERAGKKITGIQVFGGDMFIFTAREIYRV